MLFKQLYNRCLKTRMAKENFRSFYQHHYSNPCVYPLQSLQNKKAHSRTFGKQKRKNALQQHAPISQHCIEGLRCDVFCHATWPCPFFFFPSHLRRAQTFTKAAMSDAGQTERCGGSTGLLLSSVTRNLKRTGHVCPPTPGPSRRGSEGCSGSSCCWKRSSGGDLAAAAAALLSSRREWSPAA